MSSVIKISRTSQNSGLRVQTISASTNELNSEEEHWKKKIEQTKKSAYEQGRSEALLELENQFSQDLLVRYAEFENLTNSLEQRFKDYELAFEQVVTKFSIKIAEKILKQKIEEDSVIQHTINDASQKIIGAEKVMIKINPSDHELLKDSGRDLFRDEAFSKIQFESDSKIEKGGCIIESEIGNVDARISTQLNEIERKLSGNYLNEQ